MPDDVHYFYKYKFKYKKAGLVHTNIVQYFHIHENEPHEVFY